MNPSKQSGSVALLVGFVLLVMGAGLVAAFMPVVVCPGPSHHIIASYYGDCPRCGKPRGVYQQITLLRHWFWRPTPEERAEYQQEQTPLDVLIARISEEMTAEGIFQKIEETIEKANTVRVKFRLTREPNESFHQYEADGTLLLKKGGKSSLLLRGSLDKDESTLHAVSDGSKMRFQLEGREAVQEVNTPLKLQSNFAAQLARGGMQPFPGSPFEESGVDDLKNQLLVSEIEKGEDEHDAKTLTYKILVSETRQKIEAKLWYEPKSLKLLKHRLTSTVTGMKLILNEIYEEFTLDAHIPDEMFKLPAEKK